ncbi:hypothetical protein BU16DRAFT_554144 [Lophium mytilinum]|uniref:DUF7730 domain-containing protein n=1 Tax=Lophium mytilinum TaxID=390894 RepID=A0A6A6RBI2_9PEZI|nr:hypothetical protein BU16DRAFT_554144 [Lophium mytilinum]
MADLLTRRGISSDASQQANSRLYQLPQEIRDMVFDLVVEAQNLHVYSNRMQKLILVICKIPYSMTDAERLSQAGRGVLDQVGCGAHQRMAHVFDCRELLVVDAHTGSVCKKFYVDISLARYRNWTLSFDHPKALRKLFQRSHFRADLIRSIHIYGECFRYFMGPGWPGVINHHFLAQTPLLQSLHIGLDPVDNISLQYIQTHQDLDLTDRSNKLPESLRPLVAVLNILRKRKFASSSKVTCQVLDRYPRWPAVDRLRLAELIKKAILTHDPSPLRTSERIKANSQVNYVGMELEGDEPRTKRRRAR